MNAAPRPRLEKSEGLSVELGGKGRNGARRLVPVDTTERPLSGQSGHFAGTRSENETRHFNGAAELRYQLAAISVERNEPLRGCRGAHLRAAASVKS